MKRKTLIRMHKFDVFVDGEPIPEGSMKAFPFRRKGGGLGVSMVHQNSKLGDWREKIYKTFFDKYGECPDGGFIPQYTPVGIYIDFYLPKPKSSKLKLPTSKKADIDKLCRAVNDALSLYLYYDDSQIVVLSAHKYFADEDNPVGVRIHVEEIKASDSLGQASLIV